MNKKYFDEIVGRFIVAVDMEEYVTICISTSMGNIVTICGIPFEVRSDNRVIEVEMDEYRNCVTLVFPEEIIKEDKYTYYIETETEEYSIEFAS